MGVLCVLLALLISCIAAFVYSIVYTTSLLCMRACGVHVERKLDANELRSWAERLSSERPDVTSWWVCETVRDETMELRDDRGMVLKVTVLTWKYLVTVVFLCLDWGTDMNSIRNYMNAGELPFASFAMTLFWYSAFKDWKLWRDFPCEVRRTLRLGHETGKMIELRRGEVEDETILSLMLNVFGLPYAVTDGWSFGTQVFGILASLNVLSAHA